MAPAHSHKIAFPASPPATSSPRHARRGRAACQSSASSDRPASRPRTPLAGSKETSRSRPVMSMTRPPWLERRCRRRTGRGPRASTRPVCAGGGLGARPHATAAVRSDVAPDARGPKTSVRRERASARLTARNSAWRRPRPNSGEPGSRRRKRSGLHPSRRDSATTRQASTRPGSPAPWTW